MVNHHWGEGVGDLVLNLPIPESTSGGHVSQPQGWAAGSGVLMEVLLVHLTLPHDLGLVDFDGPSFFISQIVLSPSEECWGLNQLQFM